MSRRGASFGISHSRRTAPELGPRVHVGLRKNTVTPENLTGKIGEWCRCIARRSAVLDAPKNSQVVTLNLEKNALLCPEHVVTKCFSLYLFSQLIPDDAVYTSVFVSSRRFCWYITLLSDCPISRTTWPRGFEKKCCISGYFH